MKKPSAAEADLRTTGARRGLPFERILVPVDFSESSGEAFRFALPFATETGAQLELLHVLAPAGLPSGTPNAPRDWSQYEEQLRHDAAARLKEMAAAEVRHGVRPELHVEAGDPVSVIVRTARQRQADLVVVATYGRTGLKRFFLGSTAEAIVRRAPCPVLAVRRRVLARSGTPESPPSERINRILVPVDFSAASRHTLQYAVDFAKRFRASLLLLHVVGQITVPTRVAYSARELQLFAQRQATTQLAGLAERFVPEHLEAGQLVTAGTPYDVIIQTARKHPVDLIIIATRGRAGLKHLLLGSTAGRVVRHAPCPVLVVR